MIPEDHPAPAPVYGAGGRAVRAARAMATLAVAELVGKVSTLLILVGAARVLGPSDFGVFGLALSVGLLLAVIPGWGLDDLLVQRGSAEPERLPAFVGQVLSLRCLLALPATAVAISLVVVHREGTVALAASFVALAPIVDTFSQAFRATATALQRQQLLALVHLTQRLLTAVFAVLALAFSRSLLPLSVTFLSGSVLGFLLLWSAVRWIGVHPTFAETAPRDLRQFFRGSWIVAVDALVLVGVARIDVVLLGWWQGDEAAGVYSAAYRLIDTVLFVSWTVVRAVYPVMASGADDRRVRPGVERGLTVLITVFLPYAVILVIRPADVLRLVYGDAYAGPGAEALAWLAGTPLLFGAATLMGYALISRGPVPSLLVASTGALVCNLGLNAVLIPALGPAGAGAATTAAYAVLFVVLFVLVVRRFGGVMGLRALVPGTVGSACVGAVVLLPIPLIPALIAGGLAFAAAWVLSASWVDPEVVRVLRGVFRDRARPVHAPG